MPPAPACTSRIGVVGIGLAGEQRFEFAPRYVGSQSLERRFGVGDGLFVFFRFAELGHGELVVELLLHAADGLEPVLERVALAHHALGARLIVPEGGIFGFFVQLGEAALSRYRRQRCLLSSDIDCLISSTSFCVSARIGVRSANIELRSVRRI